MYGVIDGVFFCNQESQNEINEKISSRNIPSANLKPSFSFRAVPTQRTIMPIVDPQLNACVELNQYKPFNVETIFNPGTAQAPWGGFASNINLDSALRNQFFALQKAPQAKFVPSSTSTLYQSYLAGHSSFQNNYSNIDFKSRGTEPPNELLGNNFFNNNSRNKRLNMNIRNLC